MKYKPQVEVSGKWLGNALEFKTFEGAAKSAKSLYERWTLTTGWRVKEKEQDE